PILIPILLALLLMPLPFLLSLLLSRLLLRSEVRFAVDFALGIGADLNEFAARAGSFNHNGGRGLLTLRLLWRIPRTFAGNVRFDNRVFVAGEDLLLSL